MGTRLLTREEVHLFRHNGFLKLPGCLSNDLVLQLRETILKDVDGAVAPVVRNGDGRVVRLSRLLDRDPIFREVASSYVVLTPLSDLLGPNIEVALNRHNHATLNLAGKSDAFHRDVIQWTRGMVTVIFYLEETTLDNGCTMVVPGTQLQPSLTRLHNVQQEEWVKTSHILDQALPVPMPAGGMLAIDSLIFHRIGNNCTDRSRMSMTVGYHSVDELLGSDVQKRWLVLGERVYLGNDK